MESQKREVLTMKEVEAERDTAIEQVCQLSSALQEAKKNFVGLLLLLLRLRSFKQKLSS